jgi:RHS repeat-associated protein
VQDESSENTKRKGSVRMPRSVKFNAHSYCSSSLGASVERINPQDVTAKVEDQLSAFILPTDVNFCYLGILMGCRKLSYYEGEGSEEKSPLKIFCGLEEKNDSSIFCVDYSPFGLTFNSSERSGFTTNKFLFQGQEHQEETGWDSFKWRNHQPDIGRFFNIDPLAEDYYYNSPYAFSENDVISAIELEGLEKIRITNYSKIQSNKIKQNFDTRNKIQNTPPSKEEGKGLISKYVKIDSHNEEISRISRYAADNGFKDDFMVNQLEENGIEVPDAVKVGERTSEVEVEESVVLSFEFYGVQENDDGKLEIAKFGEISDTKENINKTIDGLTIVGVSAADALLGWVISKITGIELPPVSVPEDESKDKL